jgi:penicillin-binding protein 1A
MGWDVIGKTGTTDYDKDSWFVGASPYCTLAVWTGYDTPATIGATDTATTVWRKVMTNYLSDKELKEYDMPSSVIPATYCKGSGLLAASFCTDTGTGYYSKDNMPGYCNGYHTAFNGKYTSSATSSKPSASEGASGSTDETTVPGEGETTAEIPSEGGEIPSEGSGGGSEGGGDVTSEVASAPGFVE